MSMIAADERIAVFMLYQDGMTQREIARRFRISRNTVRRIIEQEGTMPVIVRSDKIQLAPDLLRRLHEQCKGQLRFVHKILTEDHGVRVGYSTLTLSLRELGLRGIQPMVTKKADDRRWLTKIIRSPPSLENTSSQFLNVIETVFGNMKKSVIHVPTTDPKRK